MKFALAAILALLIAMPQAWAQPQDVPGDHLIRIRLWGAGIEARELAAVPGRQSRDLGPALRQAAREGRLAVHHGRYAFRIAFSGLAVDPPAGTTVMVNGQPAPFSNPLTVEVVNGEGRLQIPSRWVQMPTIIILTAPPELAELHYPPPPYQQLRTAFGELARLVREFEVSNYHFVK